jgi:hypothetical protein
VESNGQPKVVTAQKGDSEEDAEAHGVGDAEVGGVRVAGVQETEEHAYGKDGGERSERAEQNLEAEAVEQEFFAYGAA